MSNFVKTICTIGPASLKEEVIEKLVLEGMDIARLNFSHSSFQQFEYVKTLIDRLNKKHKRKVKMLMDLQGPRIRVGELPGDGIKLEEGQTITFSTDFENRSAIYVNDPYLHQDIQVGHPLYLSNGEIELLVIDKKENEIYAKVIVGGILYSRKGINVPETSLTTSSLTEKDITDARFGVENNVDYIALSFVKDEKDIKRLKDIIGTSKIEIIAKIETKQSILNLEKIVKETDVLMVARGDLGIEVPLEDVPILQKKIIKKGKEIGKRSIVATQMLISMVDHPHPTRAEVSDIANAVLDGAWALMLSDETAFGKHPVASLQYLRRTIKRTEKYIQDKRV